ncbi:MAG TPA: hypothetical protein VLU24_12800 [Mycobacterium sp.]|nr:hypothetical protein [Mycobacterium sp.]
MRVLRFLWQRVLAFDRIGSRILQLIQTWLLGLFLVMPLAFAWPCMRIGLVRLRIRACAVE